MNSYPVKAVVMAKELREAGWSYPDIADMVSRNCGVSRPSMVTLRRWVDPAFEARRRAAQRKAARLRREPSWRFQMSNTSPEYHKALMRRLRDEGVPPNSIAKVCTVLFDRPVSGATVGRILAVTA